MPILYNIMLVYKYAKQIFCSTDRKAKRLQHGFKNIHIYVLQKRQPCIN